MEWDWKRTKVIQKSVSRLVVAPELVYGISKKVSEVKSSDEKMRSRSQRMTSAEGSRFI